MYQIIIAQEAPHRPKFMAKVSMRVIDIEQEATAKQMYRDCGTDDSVIVFGHGQMIAARNVDGICDHCPAFWDMVLS